MNPHIDRSAAWEKGAQEAEYASASLSAEINIATRKQHTELNRLIIERLPLALPPHAQDSTMYGLGITAFAQIYVAFEAAFDRLAQQELLPYGDEEKDPHTRDVRRWLATLRPEGLARSPRLGEDILSLPIDVRASGLADVCISIKTGIDRLAQEKPHALVAYTWIMYMAVFSGGRWIRQQLASAGPEWTAAYTPTFKCNALSRPGFIFLSFDGELDGEDLKLEYKARLTEAEVLLIPSERQDVVQAAVELFETCIEVVRILDVEAVALQARQRERLLSLPTLGGVLALLIAGLYWLRVLWR